MKVIEKMNKNILSYSYVHGDNNAQYALFESNKKINKVSKQDFDKDDMYSGVCFSNLRGDVRDNPNLNYVYVKCKMDHNTAHMISGYQRRRWLKLAIKNGLLPKSVNNKMEGDVKEYFINFSDLTQAQLYVYLATVRNLREDPGFPISVLYLTKQFGMNFFIAYVLASKVAINAGGHHIIPVGRSYGGQEDLLDIDVPLHMANSLQRFIKNPRRYDTEGIKHKYGFCCGSKISNICKSKTYIKSKDCVNPLIEKAVMASTTKTFNKFISQFRQEEGE